MKPINLSLRDICRASGVTRWQIVECRKRQSLTDHSYQVAMIVWGLCLWLGTSEKTRIQCIEYALVHDLPEVITGDLATPIKKFLQIEEKLKEFENALFFNGVNSSTFPQEIKKLVKIADLIESYMFLDSNAASDHGRKIKEKIFGRLIEMGEPVCMFVEILLSAKHTTLDDIVEGLNHE